MENLNGLNNKTSGISKTVKALESKIESLSELRNKTSRIGDVVKSLEAKVENLIALINRTSLIPQPALIPTGNLKRKLLIQLLIFNLQQMSFGLCYPQLSFNSRF